MTTEVFSEAVASASTQSLGGTSLAEASTTPLPVTSDSSTRSISATQSVVWNTETYASTATYNQTSTHASTSTTDTPWYTTVPVTVSQSELSTRYSPVSTSTNDGEQLLSSTATHDDHSVNVTETYTNFTEDWYGSSTAWYNDTTAEYLTTGALDWDTGQLNTTSYGIPYQSTMDSNVRIIVEGVSTHNFSNATHIYHIANADNGTIEPPYKDFYENAQFTTGLIIYPTICLYGLIGNILILIILAQKSMSSSTNIYLSGLAISDTIKLLNDSLYFLTILLMHTDPVAGNRCFGYLYPYAHFFVNLSVCTSAWLTVSVAVERYILVCHPTRSKSLITIARAKIISFMCFFLMTSVALPSVLRYETVEKQVYRDGKNYTELDVKLTELWQNQQFVLIYNWVQSLLRSIIPLFVLIAMNAFIINALRQTRANKRMAQRNRITIMLIIVILFFLICITPDAIMSAFFNLGYTESENFLVKGVREITDCLLVVNAAMNFTLYIIFNKIFREQFMAVFCKRCHKEDKTSVKEETQYRRLSDAKPQTAHVHANGVQLKEEDIIESTPVWPCWRVMCCRVEMFAYKIFYLKTNTCSDILCI